MRPFPPTRDGSRAVYQHLARLRAVCRRQGFPHYTVSNGNIRDTANRRDFFDMPYYLGDTDGGRRMARRQCTHQLKLVPIRRRLRELMREGRLPLLPGSVESLIGISLDEWQRMKPSDVKYVVHRWPLIDLFWTRADCRRFLAARGWSAPRSACIGCPYHSAAEWLVLRERRPEEWADAVQFESEVQARGVGLRAKPLLHAQRVPLACVQLDGPSGRCGSVAAECTGVCVV